MSERDESISSHYRRNQLPPLVPRHSHSSTTSRDQPRASGSGRPARLSHRSRAGCWTCRARKVKCDEIHPKCGPCTRLNRECDWDHRWNFSDATSTTQTKYSNVTTAGNAVWDPQARSSPSVSPVPQQHDNLPAFTVLTSDDERERKAQTQLPGTYGVVVTPESFADLPEYASPSPSDSRRMSIQSQASSLRTTTPSMSRSLTKSRVDPNVVVLDRFEDVSSPTSALPSLLPDRSRRPSLPDGIQLLSISRTPNNVVLPSSPLNSVMASDDHFVTRFRHYITRRLIQPQIDGSSPNVITPGSTRDLFEIEASRFPPLRHAICAISSLNLACTGNSTLEEALQHYHQAISAETSASHPEMSLTDGSFLRHFLLFLYDICAPTPPEDQGADMWRIHLNHLQQIATLRHDRAGRDPHAYILWSICELDTYACLLGSGNCDFFRTILQHNMLPPLDQQIPLPAPSLASPYFPDEMSTLPRILSLNQGVLVQTAKMAQAAQRFRAEATSREVVSPGQYARWQASASQLQSELASFWVSSCPEYLDPENPQSAEDLPSRARYVFKHAFILYQTSIIYARTSMFPGQRRIPVANQHDIQADTERRVHLIISVATSQLENGHLDRRHIVFPLFIAGCATSHSDVKIQALSLIKNFEGSGIGQNTYRTRNLLTAVYDEQRRLADAGRRMEDVDWLALARERGLTVVNCGL